MLYALNKKNGLGKFDCGLISLSTVHVHKAKTWQYRFLEKHEKGNRKGKDKYLSFFIASLYHLKAYKGAKFNFFLIEYVRTMWKDPLGC